ncbi:MAG: hypothetical protein GXX96_26750 [Planctomycetaceae bacterium]|nr:hypothetical protein [Planctomycetaceae bacterium]
MGVPFFPAPGDSFSRSPADTELLAEGVTRTVLRLLSGNISRKLGDGSPDRKSHRRYLLGSGISVVDATVAVDVLGAVV